MHRTKGEELIKCIVAFVRSLKLEPLDGLPMKDDHVLMIHNAAVSQIVEKMQDPEFNGPLMTMVTSALKAK